MNSLYFDTLSCVIIVYSNCIYWCFAQILINKMVTYYKLSKYGFPCVMLSTPATQLYTVLLRVYTIYVIHTYINMLPLGRPGHFLCIAIYVAIRVSTHLRLTVWYENAFFAFLDPLCEGPAIGTFDDISVANLNKLSNDSLDVSVVWETLMLR